MSTDTAALIHPVLDLARAAGQRILEIYDSDFDVVSKADESPLTAADLASNREIVSGLEALTPDIPILTEESSEVSFEERSGWSEYWLVDPLDGTKEFIKRNGEFTVNIALIRDHVPVLGVVHVPVFDTDYYGAAGEGAFKRVGEEPAERLSPARLSGGPVRVVGSRSHRGSSLDAYLEKVGPHEMVPMGSSLKICLVAAGDADVYPRLGPTCEWDTAAAQAVVEAAGGQVIDVHGAALRYNTKDEYLNPFFIVFADDSRDWAGYAS